MSDPNKTRELIADIDNYLKGDTWNLTHSGHLLIESRKQLTEKEEENTRLKAVIVRLGSMEAFILSKATRVPEDNELLARIDYAQKALEE